MPSFRVNRSAVAAVIVAAVGSLGATVVHAQANSIFPAGWDSKIRDRMFMRIGYTSSFTKTKSEEARDVTGQVVTSAQLNAAFDAGRDISIACDSDPSGPLCGRYSDGALGNIWDTLARETLFNSLNAAGMTGIGTPAGIKARAQGNVGTPTVSLGYWLDDDRKWLLEGFVLAQPMTIKIYGDGVRADGVTPNTLNGKHIATTKLLPPLVIGSYNFGAQTNRFRPYVGVGVMYAVFFGAKTTAFFDTYQGGKTTISTKNTFGAGPFVGLKTDINEDWHVNLSVGQIGLKTTSRLVTSNTQINSGAAVLNDINAVGPVGSPALADVANAIRVGDELVSPLIGSGDVGLTTLVMELVKRNNNNASDLGTYVREQKMKITNTIVTLSVGRSF